MSREIKFKIWDPILCIYEHESFMLNKCFDEGTTEVIGNKFENPELMNG